jgi:DNA-binding CsgD family transcriptional regulator
MQAQLDGLRASEGSEGPSPLLPVLAEATRHMDRRLLPTLRQIAVRNAALTTQLERYRTAELPAPDARLLERLKAIHSTQIEAIAACVQQASDADATLLALIQQADEAGVAEEARLWATDLLDVADALTAVLSGIDPYEEALSLLRLGSGGSDRAGPLLDAAEGLEPPLGGAEGMALPSETRSAQPPQRPVSPGAVRSYADGLTAREAEVLRLLASGKTSKEIAEELVVTVPTVSRHVANIYGKIDARGRADATRYAFAHGLLKTGAEADRSDAGRHGPPKDGARS